MAERQKVCLITGIRGQDAWFLSQLLLKSGHQVFGTTRESLTDPTIYPAGVEIRAVDLSDASETHRLIEELQPDDCYHLAAHHTSSQAHPGPDQGLDLFLRANYLTTLNLLTSIARYQRRCRFFYAGSSHMFGQVETSPQNEETPLRPRNVYGVTKVAGSYLCRHFREEQGIFACTGILYNHESPRRGIDFVTSKIARAAAQAKRAPERRLVLNSVAAIVDWGYAGDYVEAIHLMLRAEKPRDYVIATGEAHTVGEFAALAFARVGLPWKDYIVENPGTKPEPPVTPYIGDATRLRKETGWHPRISFRSLVELLVDAQLRRQDEH